VRWLAVAALVYLGCGDGAPPAPTEARPPDEPPVGLDERSWGERLFEEHGCVGCHNIHGADVVGGHLDGIVGETRLLPDGREVEVDESYLRSALLHDPERAAGRADAPLPSYRDRLTEGQMSALVAFLRALE
jgi:hypothetical protein